ncbi:UBX domain-containing protein [Heracleum sosnowskyi]|uniref:UBX domain-containing protein n=1 Tax=Heracleum sosnowskyi TaxID=360622 RepID=A0AAD8GRJ3_9APIA|nr:UBX domain-containing protein [Heracleum sosnowskyi]
MAGEDEEAIETFMSITGVSEPVAIQKLTEHAGNLNEAINAYFAEGDRNITNEASVVPQEDFMDVDDSIQPETHRPPFPLLPSPGLMNPFSLFDREVRSSIFDRVPNLVSSIFDRAPSPASRAPFVSHPREVREIPIEVKDGNEQSSHSGHAPTIQDVTDTANDYGPEIHGTVIIDEEDADDIPTGSTGVAPGDVGYDSILSGHPGILNSGPSAPGINNIPNYTNDIEEEMIRAAIEASKQDTESGYTHQSDPVPQQSQPVIEDPELARVVSLSLKTADQEKALRELGNRARSSELDASTSTEVEALGKLTSSGRLEAAGSSMQDKADEAEDRPLVRRRISPSPSPADTGKEIDWMTTLNPQHSTSITSSQHNKNDSHLNEWGGISSLEHDEAIMLEAALFGGVPEGNSYHVPHAPGQFRQNGLGETDGSYPGHTPRLPSPSLTAQRLIREQQDDEYFASLQADREKELKAREEAEIRRLEEQAATESALVEEKQKQEELQRKSEEHQEIERQLALKEASLPHEPSPDDGNAINLLVRMPDGSRQGRRFLKSQKLQHLFDFIDVGRVVRPGTYRLVRPYPRRAFSDGESATTFDELGLSSKQEALFLELI